MKVLIKDPEHRQYFTAAGGWTAHAGEANDFIVTTLAFKFARHKISMPFQIVLHLPESNEFIVFAEGRGRALTGAAA